MRKLRPIACLFLLFLVKLTSAQTFQKQDSLKLPTLTSPQMVWTDLNSDKYYDLLVYGKEPSSDSTQFFLFKNEGGLFLESVRLPFFDLEIHALEIIDIDKDGELDIVFSGVKAGTDTLFSSLINQGELEFQLAPMPMASILTEEFMLQDFNRDNLLELVYIDSEAKVKYLTGTALGWEEQPNFFNDSPADALFDLDLNSDGLRDLLISSSNRPDSLTRYLQNQLSGWEDFQKPFPFDNLSINIFTHGSFTKSGYPDMFLSGNLMGGSSSNFLIKSKQDTFDLTEILPDLEVLDALMADFDSDGKTDLWLSTHNEDNEFASYFLNDLADPKDTVIMNTEIASITRFADYTRDGNLDFAQLLPSGDSLEVFFFKNEQTLFNEGPRNPHLINAVQTGIGHGLIVWGTGYDSLTATELISYDVIIANSDTVALNDGTLNINTPNPRLPNHGNQLYATQSIFSNLVPGNYFHYINAADNAFNYLSNGNCKPNTNILNQFAICAVEDLEASVIETCKGSTLVLGTPTILRNWVSEKRGPLGQSSMLRYEADLDDTIYGSVVEFKNCSDGQLTYIIQSKDTEIPELNMPKYNLICPGDTVSFSANAAWSNIQWTAAQLGDLGAGHAISFVPTESQLVFFYGENEDGCSFNYTTFVEIEDFKPSVKDSVLTINVGESVELVASGGSTYEWLPSIGLSNPNIANPQASPRSDITYLVTITSENGCTETFEVQVNVTQIGGVANLFTPNGDGKNDNIVVFLSQIPREFQFSIFNRSGNLLYQTKNPQEAMNNGWNGTVNGSTVSNGVYFWSVSGQFENGQPVKLNGTTNGKISLVR
ncbi:gliding motility-associated C-terminal domain-containing protein [uncultured Roseivirga sp.]|uniref:T9SS type B sorting domain-containing protein n=1 Tax=uncultured Roseivirga sp. TaxID=543088 RepID=UPI0030DAC713|tara:strand:+ start:181455 stop:183935 length:2481 start_codon:yes stop_codon:yes gene_type:complete